MDSSGIGLVMGRFRLMQETGGKVILQNLPAPLRKVMKLAGLDKLAEIQ
ncbi:STAS domain-containing protein [Negativibacillus massiliensis]